MEENVTNVVIGTIEELDNHFYLNMERNIYDQIKSQSFNDIKIAINPYPLYNVCNIHIIIISKEGYGSREYVTSSNIFMSNALSNEELNKYINNARLFFNKNKELWKI